MLLVAAASGLAAESSFGFEFSFPVREYLPGEPLDITCEWPAEPADDYSRIRIRPLIENPDHINGGESTIGESRPRADISYSGSFGQPKCVKLRAPWLPGKYIVQARTNQKPSEYLDSQTISVKELPAADILTFVGAKTAEEAGKPYGDMFFQYDLRFDDDRCYPVRADWVGKHQQVFVMLINRETGDRFADSDMVLSSRAQECLEDCKPPPIENRCRRSGTYRRVLRVPKDAGNWDIAFVQQSAANSACGTDCLLTPAAHDRERSAVRVLARVPTIEPVPVKRLFFTATRELSDALELSDRLPRNAYLWVEFEQRNPFEIEKVEISDYSDNRIDPIVVTRLPGFDGRLFRSERVNPGNFQATPGEAIDTVKVE